MANTANDKLNRIFLLIIVIGVVHMGEQLIFGIEEFYMLRATVGEWHAMFPDSWGDKASVVLITIVFTSISLMFYALMRGGVAALVVIWIMGGVGVNEFHHWVEAFQERAYDPGLMTSFAYVAVGLMIQIEVTHQLKARWRNRRRAAPVAAAA
jgi:hypothetical protein